MIKLLFVADGNRDEAVVPPLVAALANTLVDSIFRPWKSIKHVKGYGRKLKLAVRIAKDLDAHGLVATVDSDSDGARDKLTKLNNARTEDRVTTPPFPTIIGEAIPHLEAWLLDDPVAVRETLGLPSDFEVQNVRRTVHPKDYLDELISSQCQNSGFIEMLAAIAKVLDPNRCVHASETGFKRFSDDVRVEL